MTVDDTQDSRHYFGANNDLIIAALAHLAWSNYAGRVTRAVNIRIAGVCLQKGLFFCRNCVPLRTSFDILCIFAKKDTQQSIYTGHSDVRMVSVLDSCEFVFEKLP